MRHIDDAYFREMVEEGITALPDWVREKIENVIFLIENSPSPEQFEENELTQGETLFGLYEGVPLSLRGDESPLIPDTITIFKEPILETYAREEDIRSCVHNTVWHEVAHFFGHDEEWVHEEERRRNKML